MTLSDFDCFVSSFSIYIDVKWKCGIMILGLHSKKKQKKNGFHEEPLTFTEPFHCRKVSL